MGTFQFTRILMLVLGVLEILLATRFVLHLIPAPAASGFAQFIYALLFWIILRILPIAVERPSARTVSRSVREQTPGTRGNIGTDRTTHATIS